MTNTQTDLNGEYWQKRWELSLYSGTLSYICVSVGDIFCFKLKVRWAGFLILILSMMQILCFMLSKTIFLFDLKHIKTTINYWLDPKALLLMLEKDKKQRPGTYLNLNFLLNNPVAFSLQTDVSHHALRSGKFSLGWAESPPKLLFTKEKWRNQTNSECRLWLCGATLHFLATFSHLNHLLEAE